MIKKGDISCTCELMESPTGIDTAFPRFSWMSDTVYEKQRGYRMTVSEDENMENPVWDSGVVVSDRNHLISYGGEKLKSGTRYYYRVAVICPEQTYVSRIHYFFTGILEKRDWTSCWIGGAGVRNQSYLIRWPIMIGKKVKSAAAFAASPNYYQLSLNGKPCGDSRLNGARTEYSKTLLYETYPLDLREGENVLGVEIGNGWYAMEKADRGIAKGEHIIAVQIRVEYEDHTIEWYESSPGNCFCTNQTPDVGNSVYEGESYDARMEQTGWNEPGWRMKTEKGWQRVFEQEPPGGTVRAQMMEPIRVMERRQPVGVYEISDGSYTVDFGQNFAGWVKITVCGERGQKLQMRFAEMINEDGTVNECSLNGLHAVDTYILKGEGQESFEPKFTYHGFRYVQIEGLKARTELKEIIGCVVYNDVKKIGDFYTDNKLVNRFYQAVVWTEKSNLHSIPTDCPQRAERQGWLNDMTVRNECALYNFRLPQFYRKWMRDIRDTQGSVTGAISDTAPYCRMGQRPADPVSSSFLLIPWNVYCFYGDKRIIEENYEACKRWVDYLARHSDDYIVRYSPMGDWASPKAWCDSSSIGAGAVSRITPPTFMATGYQYYNCILMKKMAKVLGKDEEAEVYAEQAEKIKNAFLKKYYNAQKQYFCGNSQACNAFPLYLGMIKSQEKYRVLEHLQKDVLETNHCHLTTGNLCSRYVVEILFLYGCTDEAFELLTQTSYPSWGYMLANGATTMWERWEKVDAYAGTSNMASFNHPMTGAVGVCFQKYIAGIRADEREPGFKNAVIRPLIPKKLRHASGSIDTIHGKLSCEWQFSDENKLNLKVQIPFNCTADVYLPVSWCRTPAMETMKGFSKICMDEGKFLMKKVGPGIHEFHIWEEA